MLRRWNSLKMSTSHRLSVTDACAVHAVSYSPAWQQRWDRFIRSESRNGNIFHEQLFLSYHGSRFEDASLLLLDHSTDRILAVLPAAVRRDQSSLGIISHPGSSYGGLVFADHIRLRTLKSMLNAAIEYYRNTYDAHYLKLIIQEPFHTGNSFDDLIFLLWHRGFALLSKEASCVKDLSIVSPDAYGKTVRQYVTSKKDQRLGITHHLAETSYELQACYQLIEQNLDVKYNKAPTHSFAELLDLRARYQERIKAFYSKYEGKTIATVVTFALDTHTVHDFYTSLHYEYGSLKPLFGLFDFIFGYYRDKGYSFFNFGISSRDRWIKWGIFEFKENFGTRVLTRDVWCLNDLSGSWPQDGPDK